VIRTNCIYLQKEDVEIVGFLSATIAWEIANDHQNSHKMMDLMGNAPYDFVMSHSDTDCNAFCSPNFNGTIATFIRA
jgi:hypothetical protein